MTEPEPNPLVIITGHLEEAFHLRPGFLRSVLQAGDWAFVIQAHALLEAGLSELLAEKLGDKRLQAVFERLEMSNSSTGKLAFAKALELLDSPARGFIRWFSELRNQLVHQVANADFTFEAHLKAMDEAALKAWSKQITFFVTAAPARGSWSVNARTNPKPTIFLGTLGLLLTMHLAIVSAKAERERLIAQSEALERFIAQGPEEQGPDTEADAGAG